MARRIALVIGFLVCPTIATAQPAAPVITPHIVTGGPVGRFVVDIEVTVDPTDVWTAGGVAGEALNGASFVYAIDPNTGRPKATAPDTGIGGRFVSFVSLPRGQTQNSRFRTAGAASPAGGFEPDLARPLLLSNEFNIAYLEFPPTRTQDSGFTVRLAWDVGGDTSGIVITTVDPGRDNTLSRVLIAHATVDFASPLTETHFWIAIPEPPSLALLLLGGLFAFPSVARRARIGGRSPRYGGSRAGSGKTLPASGVILLTLATIATAQPAPPVITPHIVTGGPDRRFVVDIEVTIDPNDVWTAGGVVGEALNGASFVYAIDPNGTTLITAPDEGVSGRFVTFVSKPLGQFQNRRFRNAGRASIAGCEWCDPLVIDPNAINVAFLEFPPTGTLGSGFNTRIALDLYDAIQDDVTLSFEEPDRFLSHIFLADATQEFSSPLTTLEFWIVPEPASLLLLLLGGLFVFGRR